MTPPTMSDFALRLKPLLEKELLAIELSLSADRKSAAAGAEAFAELSVDLVKAAAAMWSSYRWALDSLGFTDAGDEVTPEAFASLAREYAEEGLAMVNSPEVH